jgi:hypothetical protein
MIPQGFSNGMGHVPMNGQKKTYTHINITKAAKMINPPQDIAILIDLWLPACWTSSVELESNTCSAQ